MDKQLQTTLLDIIKDDVLSPHIVNCIKNTTLVADMLSKGLFDKIVNPVASFNIRKQDVEDFKEWIPLFENELLGLNCAKFLKFMKQIVKINSIYLDIIEPYAKKALAFYTVAKEIYASDGATEDLKFCLERSFRFEYGTSLKPRITEKFFTPKEFLFDVLIQSIEYEIGFFKRNEGLQPNVVAFESLILHPLKELYNLCQWDLLKTLIAPIKELCEL